MLIIRINPQESGQHHFESQSHRTECWEDGCVAVPPEKETDVIGCIGYGDLTVEDGQFVDFVPRPELIPEPPKPEPTEEELRLAALEEALAQTDETAIELYEAQMAQEEINAAQDEALIELYEMLEV